MLGSAILPILVASAPPLRTTGKTSPAGGSIRSEVAGGAPSAAYTRGRAPVPGGRSGTMAAPRLTAISHDKPPISRMEIMSVLQL
jgi:hypothetical protein